MPLKFQDGGNFIPHVRYKASTSSWEISTDNGSQPFQLPPSVFDLANLKTGWGSFNENSPPEWVWDPSLDQQQTRPKTEREWSHGFAVNILLPKEYEPQRIREFATTSTGAKEGLKALYNQFEEQRASNPGKVPVVQFMGAVPTKIGKGNTNIPTLTIIAWIDRPAALDKAPTRGPQPQSHASQGGFAQPQYHQPASTPVQPPAPTPQLSAPPVAQAGGLLDTDF